MVSVISVTKKGDYLADKILEKLKGNVYKKSADEKFNLKDVTKKSFEKSKKIIFISSTGIAVRAISEFIKDKKTDPAIVVVDICNNFTISLVSGHLGGANELTLEVSKILENTPVITTGTDNLNIKAPDIVAKENSLVIDDMKVMKEIAGRLVNGETVYYKDDLNKINLQKPYIKTEIVREFTLWITDKWTSYENVLKLVRQDIVIGIGCKRGTDFKSILSFLKEALLELDIDLRSIKEIGSIDVKKDEEGILSLLDYLNLKGRFFKAKEIEKVQDKYTKSEFVLKNVGVTSVSAPVVELLGGEVIVEKLIKDGITLSIGRIKE